MRPEMPRMVQLFRGPGNAIEASRRDARGSGHCDQVSSTAGREEQDVSFSLMTRASENSPNRTSLERHSSLTDRTHRSANAFRLGLRGASFTTWIPQRSAPHPKAAQNLASRSWSR
jgi:hypothetical protein